ncbi:MAG TPA: alanine--tRNA ligase [Gemmatimonadota bacterium]
MTADEIRSRFLDFFRRHGHTIVESSSLVPADDPTLLFTNAGMVQFKNLFLGEERRSYARAATAQKCLRVSGKHNDLENVGRTPRHHTFFEMLGNFSFGDYFKEEAIRLAWAFVTGELGLPPGRLWASVHERDDEAHGLWQRLAGLPPERVLRMGDEDNFWAMGETGPCGPCSEVFYDWGPEHGCDRADCTPAHDCGRFLELWNLVFMQYNRASDGTLTDLPRPSVDTGMGLERATAVLQGVFSNYDTDLFRPILERTAEIVGRPYEADEESGVSMRVIADHARAVTFLIADGVYPGNEGRGYVLRRIARRAIRHAWLLGAREPLLERLVPVVAEIMRRPYPELEARSDEIRLIVRAEEERFLQTIDLGIAVFEETLGGLRPGEEIPGDVVFKLYDTHGFPPDLTELMARERGAAIAWERYEELMQEQRTRARAAHRFRAGAGAGAPAEGDAGEPVREAADLPATRFVGYREVGGLEIATRIAWVARDGEDAGGQAFELLLEESPFYAAGGGQVSDTGTIESAAGAASRFRLRVEDAFRVGGTEQPAFVVVARLEEGSAAAVVPGAAVVARVDGERRLDTERHHTVTHLLHALLRRKLGEHVRQAGSLVAPDKMTFDFTHPEALREETLRALEDEANELVLSDLEVHKELLPFQEARARGAMALFGEKYGDVVRMVTVGAGVSRELCGGCHVLRTGEIGPVRIVREESAAGGVRRIHVVTGRRALAWFRSREDVLAAAAEALKAAPDAVAERVQRLQEERRDAERKLASVRQAALGGDGDLLRNRIDVNGTAIVTYRAEPVSMDDLRAIGDAMRGKLRSGVAVIGAELNGKAAILALVTDDLARAGRISAVDVVKRIGAIVGGSGGGKPTLAQAGGKDVERLDEALERAPAVVRELLGA